MYRVNVGNFVISVISSSSECSAQWQVLHCKRRNLGCSSAKGRSSTANSGTKLQFYQGLNRCGNFPVLYTPHSLFSIWTELKRSEKIPGTPTWRWGEWIWLTGLSRPPKFTTRVKYQFQQPAGCLTRSKIPITLHPLIIIIIVTVIISFLPSIYSKVFHNIYEHHKQLCKLNK